MGIYDIFTPALMGVLCSFVAFIHLYLFAQNGRKRYPKLIKSFNWLLLALVYFADAIWHPDINDIRIWFRVSLFLLFLSEIAYHGDAVVDIIQGIKSRIKAYE